MNTLVGVLAALSPILLAVLGAVGWSYRHERERRENAERQVSEHKYRAYIALLEIFFDEFKATKRNKATDAGDLFDRMADANKELMLYASDSVLSIYQRWLREAREGVMDMERFGELIVAIRRDMGNPKSQIGVDDVLRQFVTDYDQAKADGRLRTVRTP